MPNHVFHQNGTLKPAPSVGTQPMPWRLWTVVPTITARTSPISAPVTISMRL